jgi:hypothetical protein
MHFPLALIPPLRKEANYLDVKIVTEIFSLASDMLPKIFQEN